MSTWAWAGVVIPAGPCWHPAAASNKTRSTTGQFLTSPLARGPGNHGHCAPTARHRPRARVPMPGLGPAAAGQLAAQPLPGQTRAGQGPGPRRHQHRQHREGRPPGLVYCEYTSKGNTMQYQGPWRRRARTSPEARTDGPRQTCKGTRNTLVSLFQYRVNIHGVEAARERSNRRRE
jgi:hypothetical protein